jgi:hypothetical protein
MKVRVGQAAGRTTYLLWCPACEDTALINDGWGFNGDAEKPTFTPSLLTRFNIGGQDRVCHSFVTDGMWNYLGDCTHDKAGQSVPMVDLPEWAITDSTP